MAFKSKFPSTSSFQLHSLQDGTLYYWRVYVQNQYGASYFQDTAFQFKTTVVSDVKNESPAAPDHFVLSQNYPNPFNPSTMIQYEIPSERLVTLKVYNLIGQEVATLVNEVKAPGGYAAEWNAEGMPSGVYFYKMQAGEFASTKRMMLLK